MIKFAANTEKYININGIKLYTYFFSYKPNRPVAIALHGLRNDTLKMLPIIKLLEPYFNVIAFDFPGYGKSQETGEFLNYIDYGAEVLEKFIHKLEIETRNTVLVGGSYGANVIVKFLINNPKSEFKKIGMVAPIYSLGSLSMKPWFKKYLLWFAQKLAKGGTLAKFLQILVNNEKLFTFFMFISSKPPYTKEHIEHEKRLWRICSLQLWGRSVYDTITVDNSIYNLQLPQENITFIYPYSDQYLDVDSTIKGFKQLFPKGIFKHYEAKSHMPKGDFGKNKAFMDSIRSIVADEANLNQSPKI